MVAAGSNDAALHTSIALAAIAAGLSLDEEIRRLRDVLGRPLTDDERSELEAAKAKADALALQHGPEYHRFGHPPDRRA